MGPRRPRNAKLTEWEEAAVVKLRRRTLLPLDDILGCLRERLPQLSRSALHSCLVRHGISRLPRSKDKSSRRGRFPDMPPDYVRIGSSEPRPAQGKVHMLLAIDRVTKLTHVAFGESANKLSGAAFLREVIAAFPYAIHTVLTDNGSPFAEQARYRWGITDRYGGGRIVERVCREHGIEHRRTKPCHPWTNEQAERMNRTVKEATIQAFHYPGLKALKAHIVAFVAAHNFAKRFEALRWRTPFQAVYDAWAKEPSRFKFDPHHLIPIPNI